MGEYLDLSGNFPSKRVKAGLTQFDWPIDVENSCNELAVRLGLNGDQFVIPGQTHSNNVLVASEQGRYAETDAVITVNPELILTVRVADCIPFFLFDKETHNRGMVHAGWRGIVNNILPRVMEKMVECGSSPGDIFVLGGPSLQQCCFEVGPEVADQFDDYFLIKGPGDRFYVDSYGAGVRQFRESGVPEDHVISFNECTMCTNNKYHSFRRDGDRSGRMVAMIGLI